MAVVLIVVAFVVGGLVLVIGHERELVLGLLELDRHALEVKALADLPANLIKGVAQLLLEALADR